MIRIDRLNENKIEIEDLIFLFAELSDDNLTTTHRTGGQNWREVKLNMTDIERCLASKGIRVKKVELVDYNEIAEMSTVKVEYENYNQEKFKEFLDLFTSQLNTAYETDKIDRDIDISYGSTAM